MKIFILKENNKDLLIQKALMFKWLIQTMIRLISSWNRWKLQAAKKALLKIHKKIKLKVKFYTKIILKINLMKMNKIS
jgi:hypothetical protein